MTARRRLALGAGIGVAAGIAFVLERSGRRRYEVGEDALAAAGRTLPGDVEHHFVTVSDGGRIHAVERGRGPAVVLVPGLMLDLGVWAPQLRTLGEDHRVVALSMRGHGRSRPGEDGYGIARMAADLIEVLDALEVDGATLAGHSMGGMVVQVAAIERAGDLARRVGRLVLVATAPGPLGRPALSGAALAGAGLVLGAAERRGRGPLPKGIALWGARASFGTGARPVDVGLTRSMLETMSPAALAGLLGSLATFDVHDRLGEVRFSTEVVVGTRDVLTPPRTARELVAAIPGAHLSTLAGCGHMVMLEREDELCRILA